MTSALSAEEIREHLARADLEVEGRLWDSSNSAMRVVCRHAGQSLPAVYKPMRGERPLWDFPAGTLGLREVATAEIDEALGWGCVPPTVWREDGPHGPGSLQAWIDADEARAPVEVMEVSQAPAAWRVIAEGEGARGDHVCLAHEDSAALRRIALLDCLVNNADRKGGHVLRATSGAVLGIDHGLTFHTEPKLRTVLWGWAGDPIEPELIADLRTLHAQWCAVEDRLGVLLASREIRATRDRLTELLAGGRMPDPDGAWPALPWPAM